MFGWILFILAPGDDNLTVLANDDHVVVDETISSVVFLNQALLVEANDPFER